MSNDSFNDRLQVGEHSLDCFGIEPRGVINKLKVKIRRRCSKQRQRVTRGRPIISIASDRDTVVAALMPDCYRQVLKHKEALKKRLAGWDVAPAMYVE